MLHNNSQHNELIQSNKNVLSDIYQNSIVQVPSAHGIINNQDKAPSILPEIKDCFQAELQSHHGKSSS